MERTSEQTLDDKNSKIWINNPGTAIMTFNDRRYSKVGINEKRERATKTQEA